MSNTTYLEGNFAPVPDEIDAVELEITGALPEALEGRFIRTGPNPINPDPSNHHWFIGEGMVHGVSLRGGRAEWYRNRWVLGPSAAAHLDRTPTVPAAGGVFPGDGNTNLVHHAGKVLALEELSCPYVIGRDLQTLGQTDFGGPLPFGINAHPKFDAATGEMHVMGYSFAAPFMRYQVISAEGQVVHGVDVDIAGPVMVHDMGLTERFAIALDLPVLFDIELAMSGRRLPYRWFDDYTPRVGFIPRGGVGAGVRAGAPAPTIWIEIDPCYVFHPLNAYDDGANVVMDVVRHPTMFREELEGPNDGDPWLERWVFDLDRRSFSSTVIDDAVQEFPRVDERLTGLRHRYGWSAGASLTTLGSTDVEVGGSVFKHDLVAGTTQRRELGKGRIGGEFVFVPASADAAEGEGWLMSYVNDLPSGTGELVVLDAQDLSDVARVHLPRRVPVGFHGNWIPDSAVRD